MQGVVLRNSRGVEIVQDAGGVYNTGGKGNEAVGRKKGYVYSSFCDFIHILRFVGSWTQNGPTFILHNHQAPYEW